MEYTLVTFLSDFGTADPYVAEVKGALLALVAPRALPLAIVDLTHAVPPFRIEAGAFQLWRSFRHFPPGTIHLAVVDPGVGTARRGIAVTVGDTHFVGPDNGVLRWAIDECVALAGLAPVIWELLVPTEASATFHARDVFAPAIAAFRETKSWPGSVSTGELAGRSFPFAKEGFAILWIDHYGNAITNARRADHPVPPWDVAGERLPVVATYGDLPKGHAGWVPGSHGLWEIACREDSAARRFGLRL